MPKNQQERELLQAYRAMSCQAESALLSAAKMYAECFPREDARDEETKIGETSLALLARSDSLPANSVVFRKQ